MNMFTIKYNYEADHTDIKYTPTYLNNDGLTKLDLLKDAIGMLNTEYALAREQFFEELRESGKLYLLEQSNKEKENDTSTH